MHLSGQHENKTAVLALWFYGFIFDLGADYGP